MVKYLQLIFTYCFVLIACLSVQVVKATPYCVKNVVTTNYTDSSVNFFTSTEPVVKAYPNPATSYINLEFATTVKTNSKVIIYSFAGNKMNEVLFNTNKITVNLMSYTRGLYVYQVMDQSGSLIVSGKFQVIK